MTKYDILIADDHPLFRAALSSALMKGVGPGVQLVETDTIASLEEHLKQKSDWDLVLLDLNMPGASGFSGLVGIRSQYPHIPVIVISALEDASIINKARDFGGVGFIPKSSNLDIIQEAVLEVLAGNTWWPAIADEVPQDPDSASAKLASLTPQQFKVLTMVCDGLLNKQIAYDLDVSEATVKAHITAIFRKLGVRTRTQAALLLQQIETSY